MKPKEATISTQEKRSLTIKELPFEDRPRERLSLRGPEALSVPELLAILIRTGCRGRSALQLANKILMTHGNLKNIAKASLEELCEAEGLGMTKATQIKAAFELGKRLARYRDTEKLKIQNPKDIVPFVMEEMRFLDHEQFKVALLDTKNHLVRLETISVETLNNSLVHPREVFRSAIKTGCATLLLMHNHPTGDPTPSREDIDVTTRLVQAGTIVGIEILDHIIIGDKKFYSMREMGYIF